MAWYMHGGVVIIRLGFLGQTRQKQLEQWLKNNYDYKFIAGLLII